MILSSSLDADTFAISESRPTPEFLQHCTLFLQSEPAEHSKARTTYISPSSPRALAVVDRTADVNTAAQAIVRARLSRQGRSPYAPDAVLVNEFVLEEFVVCLQRHMSPYMAYENDSVGSDSPKHRQRGPIGDVQRLLDSAEKSEGMRVVVRGSDGNVISVQNR